MSLEKFKEKVFTEKSKLSPEKFAVVEKYQKKVMADKQRIFKELENDFKKVFTEDDFTISRDGNKLKAIYEGVEVSLDILDFNSFLGILAELWLQNPLMPKRCKLVVKESVTFSHGSSFLSPAQQDELSAEDLQTAIKDYKPVRYVVVFEDPSTGKERTEMTLTEALTVLLEG